MNKLQTIFQSFRQSLKDIPNNLSLIWQAGRRLGLKGVLKATWKDIFVGRSFFQWCYLLALSSVPFILEFTKLEKGHDWLGLFASWTGIVCVIMVAEGRATNYFFGFANSLVYLILSLNATFYGEVATSVFFTIMQPIGLYFWILARVKGDKSEKTEVTEFKARKLSLLGWVKWLSFTVLIWFLFGLAYQSIGSARPFRDSITDGTNWTGQFLMTYLYREQWIFWIATNVFSIYLWWGDIGNMHIVGMYFVYTLNSLVGWYQWSKSLKKGAA